MLTLATVIGTATAVIAPATTAHADPACTNGIYAVFARGSVEHLNDLQAHQFYLSLKAKLSAQSPPIPFAWSELGNEDGSVPVNMDLPPDNYVGVKPDAANAPPYNEYPASVMVVNASYDESWAYNNSVTIGTNELIAHLNDRVARCPQESIVVAAFSQAADLVGWALQRTGWGSLNQTTRNHIGYVALYGDPKFNPGGLAQRQQWQRPWWVRGDDTGFRYRGSNGNTVVSNAGLFGYRDPYVPPEFNGRFGSWCAYLDAICTGEAADHPWDWGTHGSTYQNYWIGQSTNEIANKAISMRNQLNPQLLPATGPSYTITGPDPVTNPPVSTTAPIPTVLQVKRSLAPDGTTHEVYAATNSTVTEGWWQPGGDGVHTDELIHISQDNIVGFDKVSQPDGVTQSLYTAVPDGVWETWWRPGDGPYSNKIVSGLTGVRQVIVANAYEGSQFVHRLYLLAQDGPYEVWWKDGGDGVHVNRLNNITGGVAMTAGTGPDGSYEVYVATPTWVYELWWVPGGTVNSRTILNVTQGDIRSLDKDTFGANGELLYTGTSTSAWQSYWTPGSGIETHAAMSGQVNAVQVKKDNYAGVHELYLATGNHVQEYWWKDDGSNGTSTLITISQNNITSFDKSDDGAAQQVYTASGDIVYETWWAAGVSPTSSVLFKVAH